MFWVKQKSEVGWGKDKPLWTYFGCSWKSSPRMLLCVWFHASPVFTVNQIMRVWLSAGKNLLSMSRGSQWTLLMSQSSRACRVAREAGALTERVDMNLASGSSEHARLHTVFQSFSNCSKLRFFRHGTHVGQETRGKPQQSRKWIIWFLNSKGNSWRRSYICVLLPDRSSLKQEINIR